MPPRKRSGRPAERSGRRGRPPRTKCLEARPFPYPREAKDDGAEDRHDERAADGTKEIGNARGRSEFVRPYCVLDRHGAYGQQGPEADAEKSQNGFDPYQRKAVPSRDENAHADERKQQADHRHALVMGDLCHQRPREVGADHGAGHQGDERKTRMARRQSSNRFEIDRQVDCEADIGSHAEAGRQHAHAHDWIVQDAGGNQRLGGGSHAPAEQAPEQG